MFRAGLDVLRYLVRAGKVVTTDDENQGFEPGISLSFGYKF